MKRKRNSSIVLRRRASPNPKRRKYVELPFDWVVQQCEMYSPEEYIDNWMDEYYIVEQRKPFADTNFKYILAERIVNAFTRNGDFVPNADALQELGQYVNVYLGQIQEMIQTNNISEVTRDHLLKLLTYTSGSIPDVIVEDIESGVVPLHMCAYMIGRILASHTRQFVAMLSN